MDQGSTWPQGVPVWWRRTRATGPSLPAWQAPRIVGVHPDVAGSGRGRAGTGPRRIAMRDRHLAMTRPTRPNAHTLVVLRIFLSLGLIAIQGILRRTWPAPDDLRLDGKTQPALLELDHALVNEGLEGASRRAWSKPTPPSPMRSREKPFCE